MSISFMPRQPQALNVTPAYEWLALSLEEQRDAANAGYLPGIAGSDGEGEGGGEGGTGEGSGEGEGSGAGGAGEGSGSGSGEGEGEGEGGGEGDGDNDDDDVLEIRRGDYNHLRESMRKQEKAEKEREKAEREARARQQREQGRFEEMIKEEAERREAIEAERDEAKLELYNERRQARVSRIAKLIGFKDPEDALHNITDEDSEDDAKAERALRKVATKKPYLVERQRSTGVPVGGPNGGRILTLDQIRGMDRDEIIQNWEAVSAAMAAGSG